MAANKPYFMCTGTYWRNNIIAFCVLLFCNYHAVAQSSGSEVADCSNEVIQTIEAARHGDDFAKKKIIEWTIGEDLCHYFMVMKSLPVDLSYLLEKQTAVVIHNKLRISLFILAATRLHLKEVEEVIRMYTKHCDSDIGYVARGYFCKMGDRTLCGTDKDKAGQRCREEKPRLGIIAGPEYAVVYSDEYSSKRLFVEHICPGSRAELSGFHVGDEPLSVNDAVVDSPRGFVEEVMKASFPIVIRLRRDGKEIEIIVKE